MIDLRTILYHVDQAKKQELISFFNKWKESNPDLTFGKKHYEEVTLDSVINYIKEDIDYTAKVDAKNKAVDEAMSKGESSIPKERWGVHETHCCIEHGCKYGDKDCPVEMGLIQQRYICESCDFDNLTLPEILDKWKEKILKSEKNT